jgi:hypothetical protein
MGGEITSVTSRPGPEMDSRRLEFQHQLNIWKQHYLQHGPYGKRLYLEWFTFFTTKRINKPW